MFAAKLDMANQLKEDKLHKIIEKFYNLNTVAIYEITRFHFGFKCIHSFQDDNGRISRFIYKAIIK